MIVTPPRAPCTTLFGSSVYIGGRLLFQIIRNSMLDPGFSRSQMSAIANELIRQQDNRNVWLRVGYVIILKDSAKVWLRVGYVIILKDSAKVWLRDGYIIILKYTTRVWLRDGYILIMKFTTRVWLRDGYILILKNILVMESWYMQLPH